MEGVSGLGKGGRRRRGGDRGGRREGDGLPVGGVVLVGFGEGAGVEGGGCGGGGGGEGDGEEGGDEGGVHGWLLLGVVMELFEFLLCGCWRYARRGWGLRQLRLVVVVVFGLGCCDDEDFEGS